MNKETLKEMQKKDESIINEGRIINEVINEGHKHNLFEYCICAAMNEFKHKRNEYDTADNFMAAVMGYATAMCEEMLRQIEQFQKSDCLYF